MLEEEDRRDREKEENERSVQQGNNTRNGRSNNGVTSLAEIDRTVKIRWAREGVGLGLDKHSIESLFSRFGKIESAFTLKDKRQRVGEKRGKKILATVVLVFASIVGAHAAVEDSKKQQGDEWYAIESVSWAANKEPDFGQLRPSPSREGATNSMPSTPAPASKSRKQLFDLPGLTTAPLIPPDESNGTTKSPSFASFSPASTNTPQGPSARTGAGLGFNGPSFEEITLIRLKNAERKRLEDQIQKDEAAAPGEIEKAN